MKYSFICAVLNSLVCTFFSLDAHANVEFVNKYLKDSSAPYYLTGCSDLGSALRVVSLPKNHYVEGSLNFNYYYKHIEKGFKDTVIFLPGGPGGASMAWSHKQPDHFNNYNMIYIDPRGVGCNFFRENDFSLDLITTEQTAFDIAEVIKKEDLKSYHIYGESYGTYLGITLTSILNTKFINLNQPKNLVLEGTLARSLPGPGAFLKEGAIVANILLNRDLDLKRIFSSQKLPLSYSSDFWADFLARLTSSSLNFKDEFTRWDKLVLLKESLVSSRVMPLDLEQYFKEENQRFINIDVVQEYENDQNEFIETVISCQEIETSNFFFYKYKLENGVVSVVRNFNARGEDPCGNYDFKGFDLKKYPVTKTPTVYIHGELDPATPIGGAKQHYIDSSVRKEFIEVIGSAHAPLEEDLKKCSTDLFKTITDGTWNFDSLINEKGWCK